MIGLVFAPSRRQVSLEQAMEIADAVRGCEATAQDQALDTGTCCCRPSVVGVFVNLPPEEVNAAAEACSLDYIQLSGDESPNYCRTMNRPFVKSLRLASENEIDEMAGQMDAYLRISPDALFLLDTHMPGVYGGSGHPWDWERCALLAGRYPILVAGGLDPENVAGIVKAVAPWGVDVSSGVETNGVKDEAKIKAFIEAVRSVSPDRFPS